MPGDFQWRHDHAHRQRHLPGRRYHRHSDPGSGATNINVTPDPNTPQATTLTINGLVRNQGGTVNFASTGTVSLPGQSAGLIGPWATIGNGENSPTATGTLEFATVSGGGNLTALGAHNTGDISTWGGKPRTMSR